MTAFMTAFLKGYELTYTDIYCIYNSYIDIYEGGYELTYTFISSEHNLAPYQIVF